MDDLLGDFFSWLISRVGRFFIREYRGCAVAFYGLLSLIFLGGMVLSLVGVIRGQLVAAIGIVGCLVFFAIFGWLLYRGITSPTWPPQ